MKPAVLLVLAAYGGGSSLAVDPASLAFGEVDFQQAQPEAGYAAVTLRVRNEAKRSAIVTIRRFDDLHLVLSAFTTATDPPTLPALESGAETTITVGVGGYDLGERDLLVEGAFEVWSDLDRDPFSVPWSFTPIRNIGDDTGR